MSSLLTRPPVESSSSPAPATAPERAVADAPAHADAPARDSFPLRLAAFAALALFGALHWAGLVQDAPVGRTLGLVLFVTAGAAVIWLLRPLPARVRFTLAAATAVAVLLGGLVIAGLEARLLWPGNWGELGDGLDRGLSGVNTVNWPYDGAEPWIRQAILLGAPLLLAIAAALGFWPARRGNAWLRGAGLVVLLILYGTAVTEHDPGTPVLRGLVLLLLVAAWLWLPRLAPREAANGAALVLAIGVCAIPLAVSFDGDRPWWDYRGWNWFGGSEKAVSFSWEHSYGPLDWPRDGTTLLNVRSQRAHFWKVQTLDRFDGFRWLRSGANDRVPPGSDLPQDGTLNRRWFTRLRVSVRGLRSDLIVGAGSTLEVEGAGIVSGSVDGTFTKLDGTLKEGDSYSVTAYAPDPSSRQMRGAPEGYSAGLAQYTAIFLPRRGETALGDGALRSDPARSTQDDPPQVLVPLRDEPLTGTPGAEQRLLASPYGRMYRLAQRLTATAPTSYDAVRNVERWLRTRLKYSEDVPERRFPLSDFVFRDRAGYCQQFSGAMALMLRMAGIPARVVSGFSPGSRNTDTGEYRIRDLDAHSWVEVQFNDIGWVPFDPTPAAAPARRSLAPNLPSAASSSSTQSGRGDGPDSTPSSADSGADGSGMLGWLLAAAALLAASATGWVFVRSRSKPLGDRSRAEAQARELVAALRRLGWELSSGTTLLDLERRLRRVAGPAAAGYAATLRGSRYDPRQPAPPGARDRRALRRELGRIGGLRGRLRALLALPPAGLWGGAQRERRSREHRTPSF